MGGWQDRGSLRVCVFVLLRGILLSVCVSQRECDAVKDESGSRHSCILVLKQSVF